MMIIIIVIMHFVEILGSKSKQQNSKNFKVVVSDITTRLGKNGVAGIIGNKLIHFDVL